MHVRKQNIANNSPQKTGEKICDSVVTQARVNQAKSNRVACARIIRSGGLSEKNSTVYGTDYTAQQHSSVREGGEGGGLG